MSITRRSLWAALALPLFGLPSCAEPVEQPDAGRPNVLWVIWDTVRADHLGVYGYGKPTTPHLERWAKGARVFEHCSATAGQTLPSTASMFTGLFPTEHGTNPRWPRLEDRFPVIAELFRDSGYRTYLFAANPYLSSEHNFQRGFEVEEHPWDDQYREEAIRIVRDRLAFGDHAERRKRVTKGEPSRGDLQSAGELAQVGLEKWLRRSDRSKPFFTVLNYMEAHIPYVPPRKYRERMLTAEQVPASYRIGMRPWRHTFGLFHHSDEDIALINGVYDGALAELDQMFADLLAALEASGNLEHTIVVLTSDHGEHLGDHGMLEHQFSLYEGLIHVPLIVHYPPALAPGRDTRPVSGVDLFPTLLELAGIGLPQGSKVKGVSLLATETDRLRLAEYPVVHEAVERFAERLPDWDPSRWRRLLRAIYAGPYKLIVADDGHKELYRFSEDPLESENLIDREPEAARRLSERLQTFASSLDRWDPEGKPPEMSPEQYEALKALGYVGVE